MTNLIVIIIILAIIIAAIVKIVVEKRKGSKCVGCPHGKAGKSSCACDSK